MTEPPGRDLGRLRRLPDPRRDLAGRPGRPGAGSWSSTGSRATAAGITASAGPWPRPGYEAHFPDRRGSGANRRDRGHTPSTGRLLDDVAEYLADRSARRDPASPIALAGISWGGKLAVITAGRRPDLVDALALICPGLHPRVGVSRGRAAADRPGLLHRPPQDASRSP